jgi:myo-inositol-1(or 4)-monophosphatase
MVTEVDLQSEKMIVDWITERYPDHNIVTEERDTIDHKSDYSWIIDPLDGTTNYSRGIPVFAISIALHCEGKREMGWVHAPYTGDLYTAQKGAGAFYNGKRLSPLKATPIKEAIVASGFAYDHQTNPDNNTREVSRIIPNVKGFRRMGAAAYDLCLVAHGCIDGFWERGLKPWDVEAALLMIEEVGGEVASTKSMGGADILVSGNSTTVKDILSILNKD